MNKSVINRIFYFAISPVKICQVETVKINYQCVNYTDNGIGRFDTHFALSIKTSINCFAECFADNCSRIAIQFST